MIADGETPFPDPPLPASESFVAAESRRARLLERRFEASDAPPQAREFAEIRGVRSANDRARSTSPGLRRSAC